MLHFFPRASGRRAALSLLAAALASQILSAQTAQPSPESSPGAPKTIQDYSQQALIFERLITNVCFESDGTSTERVTRRFRIQSQAGVQAMAVLAIGYASATDTASFDSVRVRKPDGSEIVTPPGDTQDVTPAITQQAPMYSDLHEKHLTVKGLGVGDTLEFAFTVRRAKPLAPGKYWLDYNFSRDAIVLSEVLSVNAPEGSGLRWRSPGETPMVARADGRETITWTHSQMSLPSAEEQQKEAQKLLQKAGRGLLPPAEVMISNFASWAEVADWYRGLEKDRILASPAIEAKAAQLTKGLATPEAKAAAIYKYVSTQVHYIGVDVGIGRFQPHAADEVLSNQYGDCKDKHTLLAALLSAAGIPSSAVLIGASHALDPEIASPAQIDHVISQLRIGGATVWADTTSGAAPFGYLTSTLRGKQAVLVADKGAPALVTTPLDPPRRNIQTFRIDATLDDAGTLQGKVRQTFEGGDGEVLLAAGFAAISTSQYQAVVQSVSQAQGFGGEISDVRVGPPQDAEKPFEFSYTYTRKDDPDWAQRRLGAPLPPLELPNPDEKPADGVWLGSPAETIFESSVQVPKDYQAFLPPPLHLVEPFAEFHQECKFQGGKLITTRRLVSKEHEVAPADWERYQKFAKAVAADSARRVGIVPEAQGRILYTQDDVWDLPMSERKDANQAYADAQTKSQQQDVNGEIVALSKAVEMDPHFTRAWLWMGEIQRSSNHLEEAAAADRHAITVDPRNGLAYKALALVLWVQGKKDEQAAALKSLTGLEPENAFAWYALGMTLLDLKKKEDARAALAESVRLNPDWSASHLSLGNAELLSGDRPGAETEFAKALAIRSSGGALNDIAFQLAEAGADLPMALDYAQRAVKEAEENSRALTATNMDEKEFAAIWKSSNELTMYWDTLGWVCFKMGKDADAKKYLIGAWDVGRVSAIGSHLSDLFERLGDTDAALNWAHSAFALSPENARPPLQARIERLSKKPRSSVRSGSRSNGMDGSMRPLELTGVPEKRRDVQFLIIVTQLEGANGMTVQSVKQMNEQPWPSAEKAIRDLKFDFQLPGKGVRAAFDGIASCSETGRCSLNLFTLMERLPPGFNPG